MLIVDLVVELGVVLVAVIANQQQRLVDRWSGPGHWEPADLLSTVAANGFSCEMGIGVLAG